MTRVFLAFSLFVLASAGALAQGGRPTPGGANKANARPAATPVPTPSADSTAAEPLTDDEVITVNTQIVSLPVRVMDKKGRFVAGLAQGEFTVTENGEPQEIAMFANESEPFTVALMLDMSYSTTFKIAEIQAAAIEFIEQLRPQDRIMVVSFDGSVHVLCKPTGDRKEIYAAIRSTKIDTGTSLYEAVGTVMNDHLRRAKGRKAVILFTDGVDTSSRLASDLSNLSDAMELDALIYPIRYDTFADVQRMKDKPVNPGPPPIRVPTSGGTSPILDIMRGTATVGGPGTTEEDYRKAREYLDGLATRTGGRVYEASTMGNLSEAYRRIASELREFYSIGYYPKTERVPGKRASVKVKVAREGLVVRARDVFIGRQRDKK